MSMASGMGISQTEGLMSTAGSLQTSQTFSQSQMSMSIIQSQQDLLSTKAPASPFYIIKPDSSVLSAFKVVTGLLSMPSVAAYLFIIAFGFKETNWITMLAYSTEIFYGLEIVLNFITSFRDLENFQTVTSLKRIAQ